MKNKILTTTFVLAALFVTKQASAYYSPSTGRWLSRDPMGEPGFETLRMASAVPKVGQDVNATTLPPGRLFVRDLVATKTEPNRYACVNNNPIYAIDFLGLASRKRNPNNSQSVSVADCEIVILIGHGGSGRPHTFSGPNDSCWAGGFIGCYAGETNGRIGTNNQIPGAPDWHDVIEDDDPDYDAAWAAIQRGAKEKAKSICKNAKCCCKEVTITFLYAPAYDIDDLKRPALPDDIKVKCN